MAERQNPFSPSNSSAPPLIPTPTSLPSTDPALRAGFLAQAPQEQPMYATIAPKSQRKDHTSHPPSLPPPTMSLSPSSSVGPSDGGSNPSTLALRVKYLEGMVSRLTSEKKGMEEEFGRQRKRFMEQMISSEGEMKKFNEILKKNKQQIETLNVSLLQKDEEMSSMAKTMNASLRETFDSDRVKYEEEISILKLKLQETSHEHQVQVQKLKAELSREKKRTAALTDSKSDSNLLDVQSPVKPSSGRKSPQRTSQTIPVPAAPNQPQSSSSSAALNFSSEGSLESSMIQAAHDAKLLKSVVVPLEAEIEMLRMQLKDSQDRLKVYEGKASGSFLTASPEPLSASVSELLVTPTATGPDRSVSPLETGGGGEGRGVGSLSRGSSQDVSEVGLLEKLLNQERTARYDLEMHIESLRRQKTSVMDLNTELKEDLATARKSLEEEKEKYAKLEAVWTKANLSFISTQDQLKQKLKDVKVSDERNLKAALEPVGAYSPRPSSPTQETHTHTTDDRMSMRPGGRGRGRKRTVSWSVGDDHTEEKEDLTVWKAITEQLQRLLSQQHHDLQSKEAAVTAYEKQLERTQGQLMSDIDEKDNQIFILRHEIQKIQATLLRERYAAENMKRKLATAKESMKNQVTELHSSEAKVQQKHKVFKEKFTETRHDIQKQLASFTEERTSLYGIISQREEEYACLKDLQTSEKIAYQSELDQLKKEKAEAELNVASTMEELTRLREQKVANESRLSAELSELREVVSTAKQEKDNLESQLLSSLNENTQLEKERHFAILSNTNFQEKSKDYIEENIFRISELEHEKEENAKTIHELKTQLSQLKKQLANNELVQKDFVQLSQSLQTRLVEVESRQQEEELIKLTSQDST
ncbi:PREDICTED: myosin-11-like [Amphimedon queenslandica]|uniref:Rabaptin coiled-coil domain-containing protein n=1 Tax=Amphimedon queenslandica TaxID=400682 RepID=A0A1X7UN29_AMPQE|nr:PREDICTED: myosin-11-like [Amphimedon queenslandica]|eukprot:XP_003387387.1 PREDICTED: myosin-11-like [Amphimedon queenslandica]